MNLPIKRLLSAAAGLLLSAQALAFQAGWSQTTVPGPAPITVVLVYPTEATERTVQMGPFTVHAAINAEPVATVKGLILLSHGTGGSELGHSSLAEALARSGYLVAALRHPGDNWQDRSLLAKNPQRFFDERPRQATQVISALLGDSLWKDRVARDAKGPRVGAVGHSAGGYTVLALAGARPDLARIVSHCAADRAADAIFCGMGQQGGAPANAGPAPDLADHRVRAVAVLAPVGVPLTAESLAAVRIPTALYAGEFDRFLVPRFHADWVTQNLPGIQAHKVSNAGHFAFMDTPSMAIDSPDGDIGANPAGFDRAAFLKQLALELPSFFDQSW
jgi:predicted dienelactone hydrolase